MRITSRVVRGGVWCALLLNASGASAHTAAGTIAVTVLRDCPTVPAHSAQVSLVGTAMFSTTSALGKASFTVSPGTYQVQARLPGYTSTTATVSVTDGATTNVTLTLGSNPCGTRPPLVSVTPVPGLGGTRPPAESDPGGGTPPGGTRPGGPGDATGTDRVSTGGSHSFYGLVDIRIGAATDPAPCENDRVVQGSTGIADLLTNALTLIDAGFSCHGAAWVFAEDQAPWFSNTTALLPWTNSTGDVVTATLPAGRLRVPVTFWLDPTVNAAQKQDDLKNIDLPAAEDFLLSARTGLRLTNSEAADTPPDIVNLPLAIGSDCPDTPNIIASTKYRVNHINVYVVGSLSALGRNCRENGAANVVFMDDNADFVTLVHEIGHALGLMRPFWGHAQSQPGMHANNFMWKGTGTPIHATLGQIARMHADQQSWLNMPSGTGTVRTRQPALSLAPSIPCSCPGNVPTPDCPRMDTDIPRGGAPSSPPLDPPACYLTTVPCLYLSPGATDYVTAFAWADVLGTIPGGGSGMVASLTPSLATAVMTSSALGRVKGMVTAGTTTGVARILMSYGGNMVEVPVKIGSPCP